MTCHNMDSKPNVSWQFMFNAQYHADLFLDLQLQADLTDSHAVAAAKADEVSRLQFQIELLEAAKERVEVELHAAAAASHSAAQVGSNLHSL